MAGGGLTNLYSQGLSYGRGLTTLPFVEVPDRAVFAGAGSLTASAQRLLGALAVFGGAGSMTVAASVQLDASVAMGGAGSMSADTVQTP